MLRYKHCVLLFKTECSNSLKNESNALIRICLKWLVILNSTACFKANVLVSCGLTLFNSSCTFLQVEVDLLFVTEPSGCLSVHEPCIPRRPASAVTTYSHLAAALLWEKPEEDADFPLISFHLLYKPRLNNTTHFQCSLKRVLTLSAERIECCACTHAQHQQKSSRERDALCL